MKKTAYIIDPISKGSYHEVINMTYLYIISKNYDKVIYISDKSSFDNLTAKLSKSNMFVSNVINKHITHKTFKPKKYLGGIVYCITNVIASMKDIYYYVKTNQGADVFYNNNILFGLNTINFISRIKKNRLFIMCHSEINILEKKKIGKGEIITRLLLRFFLKNKISPYLTYIVLGDNIRLNVLKHSAPCNENRIRSLDHPYFREPYVYPKIEIPEIPGRIKIGIPSLINKNRGLDSLNYLLNKLPNQRIYDIYSIGRVVSDGLQINSNLIQLNNSKELLSSEIYTAYIRLMDCSIFFVNDNEFGASGGILEAIWEEKIIISLSNSYVNYIFHKFGKMGYVFEDLDEMIYFLNNNIDKVFKDSDEFLNNIRKAKTYLHPNNMVKTFKAFLDENN